MKPKSSPSMYCNPKHLFFLFITGLTLASAPFTQASADEIRIDFGATAPASANWNQFAMTASTTTVSNLVRSSNGLSTEVSLTVTGISGNGNSHLVGAENTSSTIYSDHIYAQDKSPDDTLTFTISGLDDSQTYDLMGGFKRNNNRFEHVWTVGSDVRTNTFDGTNVDGYETFAGLSPSGGVITFTISDLNTSDDWASIAELTIMAQGGFPVLPVAYAQSVRTKYEIAIPITLTGNTSGLAFSVTTNPTHGMLSSIAPNLIYMSL